MCCGIMNKFNTEPCGWFDFLTLNTEKGPFKCYLRLACNCVCTGMWWGQALHCTFRSGEKTPGP